MGFHYHNSIRTWHWIFFYLKFKSRSLSENDDFKFDLSIAVEIPRKNFLNQQVFWKCYWLIIWIWIWKLGNFIFMKWSGFHLDFSTVLSDELMIWFGFFQNKKQKRFDLNSLFFGKSNTLKHNFYIQSRRFWIFLSLDGARLVFSDNIRPPDCNQQ